MKLAAIITFAVVVGLLAVPMSSATVMHATINTETNVGTVNATSNYVLYFTYPANSSLAGKLNGTTIWYNATAYANSTLKGVLQDNMNVRDSNNQNTNDRSNETRNNSANFAGSHSTDKNSTQAPPTIHIVNATINYQVHAFANSTNLTVYRNLTLNLVIGNITKKGANNTTVIDMSWRAFGVQGKLETDFHGMLQLTNPNHQISVTSQMNSNVDVNELGDLGLGNSLPSGGMPMDLGNMIGDSGFGGHVRSFNTINFNVFSKPLTQWTRVYNSTSNSTTFYDNVSSSFALNSTVQENGSTYTIKVMVDPTASITTDGYATPTSSNSLTVYSAPAAASISSGTFLVIGLITALVLVVLGVVINKRRSKH